MKIALDVDGVACDTIGCVQESLLRRRKKINDRRDFLRDIALQDALSYWVRTPHLLMELRVQRGFLDFFRKIQSKHEVFFLTARKHHPDVTSEWIRRNISSNVEVKFCLDKSKFDFDLLVDDSYEQVWNVLESGRSAVLIRHPWTRELDLEKNIRLSSRAHISSGFRSVHSFIDKGCLQTL